MINSIISKNADAIERIDKEIARRKNEASEDDIVQMVNTEKVVEIQKNYKSTNICKFWQSNSCKRNIKCDFLHVTMVSNDDKNQAHKSNYKCVSCKNAWEDASCIVRHIIKGHETFFCLNCEDWVKLKGYVFDKNWTLFDEAGYLRIDI